MLLKPKSAPQISRLRKASPTAGFSLIELSVVIAIVSIVAVMGLEMTSTFFYRTAYKSSMAKLEAIDAAIVAYRREFARLPCPAPNTTPNNVCYGKGRHRSGPGNVCDVYTVACAAAAWGGSNYRWGDVPVKDLGLPLSYMTDGYGNKFAYAVTANLTDSATYTNTPDGFVIRSGKQDTTCGTAGNRCQNRGSAAFIVMSYGRDGRGARKASGNATQYGCRDSAAFDGMVDTVNCRFDTTPTLEYTIPDNVFYDSRYNAGTQEQTHFDDLIKWRSKSNM